MEFFSIYTGKLMNFAKATRGSFYILAICISCTFSVYGNETVFVTPGFYTGSFSIVSFQEGEDANPALLKKLNDSLKTAILAADYIKGEELSNKISGLVETGKITDSILLSDSYYYRGTLNLFANKTATAIAMLDSCREIRELKKTEDVIYANSLTNTGLAYYTQGDNFKAADYYYKALVADKKLYGENSAVLIQDYGSLTAAYLEINNYESAINTANAGLILINKSVGSFPFMEQIYLLHNIAIAYGRQEDYSKALIYLENALDLFETNALEKDEYYINLLNSLGNGYYSAGMTDKAIDCYERGMKAIGAEINIITLNFINSYSIMLAKAGFTGKGKALLSNSLAKACLKFGTDSRDYCVFLREYASYLNDFCNEPGNATEYFAECTKYINDHSWDTNLRDDIFRGYALALSGSGRYEEALEKIQEVLVTGTDSKKNTGLFENPSIEDLNADRRTLRIVMTKYEILKKMFEKNHDPAVLKSAASTSELLIAILEKVRINISEEESMLILGDNYRSMYINVIRDNETAYKLTGEYVYFEKAFEYSERSKVAGLLALTREMKATQFNVPAGIADLERDLQREIGSYKEMISNENATPEPDKNKISTWNGYVLDATRRRDSLVKVFEKSYPEYYKIKYNTNVVSINEILKITGRKDNYLSYVMSDTVLYTFIINGKYQKLITTTIDSGFYNNINEFVKLLSYPSGSKRARADFNKFKVLGYSLYLTLLDTIKEYITNERLIISPDNILSYLPFETLLTKTDGSDDIIYRDLPYLLFEYDMHIQQPFLQKP
jgi:tetratricopeptide (TPR) repeat protein